MLIENYYKVQDKIAQAALEAGRKREEITLLAVSKFHSASSIATLAKIGQKDFAENYVQEANQKFIDLKELLPNDIYKSLQWHSIGHIQTNKAKEVIHKYTLLHCVDSVKLSQSLNRLLEQNLQKQDILLEINIGEESQKHGIFPKEAEALIEKILVFPQLSLKGFMCLPPFGAKVGVNRKYFKALYELKECMEQRFKMSFPFLSMGTSSDYTEAILEGATHIRVGTEIFGERQK